MPCPDYPTKEFSVTALNRVQFTKYMDDFNVGDELEVTDVWIKERNDVAVPDVDARPSWIDEYTLNPLGGGEYTGDYVGSDGSAQNGTIERAAIEWDFSASMPSWQAEVGNTLLLGIRFTDNIGDEQEDEFCLEYVQFGTALSLLIADEKILGGPLDGGTNSLSGDRVTGSIVTNVSKRDLGWDPVRKEVIYGGSTTFSGTENLYRSTPDLSNQHEKIADGGGTNAIRAVQVFGREVFVIEYDGTSYKVNLDTLARTNLADPPNGSNHWGQLTVMDGVMYGFSGNKLYTIDSAWNWTEIDDLGFRGFMLTNDGGLLYFVNISDDAVKSYDPGTNTLTDLGWSTDAQAGFEVVDGIAYRSSGTGAQKCNVADGSGCSSVHDGGSVGTVLAIQAITQQL